MPTSGDSDDKYTMVFLDLDDTLIPTRIRRMMNVNLGINIFDTLSCTLLAKLQYSVIKAIDVIKTTLQCQHKQIKIAIVSNAEKKWIDNVLSYIPNRRCPKLSILGKYLVTNGIAMYSAIDEMRDYLLYKYGEHRATKMFLNITNGDNEKRWIWKYTTFHGILLQYEQNCDKRCERIISFGDGMDEATALFKYSRQCGIKCDHINFVNSPTINQLQKEWKYIADNFDDIAVLQDTKNNNFIVYDLNKVFKSDNNRYCSGQSDQIKAIGIYFQLWMNDLDQKHKDDKTDSVNAVCMLLHAMISKTKKAKHLKIIANYLRKNEEFDMVFTKYCKQ